MEYTDEELDKEFEVLKILAGILDEEFEVLKDSPEKLLEIWRNTSPEIQREKFDKVIEVLKDSPEGLLEFWRNTSPEIQIEKFDKVIEVLKDSPDNLLDMWRNKSPEIQREKFDKVFEVLKDSPDNLIDMWRNTSPEIQREKLDEVFEVLKDSPQDLCCMWVSASPEIKREKFDEVFEVVKDSSQYLCYMWEHTSPEIQREKFDKVFEVLKDSSQDLCYMWEHTSPEIQREKFDEVIEVLKDSSEDLVKFWRNTSPEIKREKFDKVFEVLKDSQGDLVKFWRNTSPEIQRENFDKMIEVLKDRPQELRLMWVNASQEIKREKFDKVFEVLKDSPQDLYYMWAFAGPEIQREKFDKVFEVLKDSPQDLYSMWVSASQEIQREKFDKVFEVLKDSPQELRLMWVSVSPEIQREKFDKVFEVLKDSTEKLLEIWRNTRPEIQREKFDKVFEALKDSPQELGIMWANTYLEIQIEKFDEVFEVLKDSPQELRIMWEDTSLWEYISPEKQREKFDEVIEVLKDRPQELRIMWENTSPEIQREKFDKVIAVLKDSLFDGDFIMPEELADVLVRKHSDEIADKVSKNLFAIMLNWNSIKRYIQIKRANNIVNSGLEVRPTNINEILEALWKIQNPRPEVKSISAQEFEDTKGSERVGQDTQYTNSISTAVQRAHTLSEKMDEMPCIKMFPDFSVSKDDMNIRLLHPQDKSAILLGYDTNCCFRPNGNADNSAINEYSLLQYCTTTPYGGVLRCENEEGSEVYMGTPVLVNGNCMMFHSYETANNGRADEVNLLLVEAAKKVLMDDESLSAIFMTNLHENQHALHTYGKIKIPSFFSAYTKGELSVYEKMYNNLNYQNVVLAARVNGEILSGPELMQWYEQECESNPEVFKEKLNLHMGERTKEFDFGRREVKNQIVIQTQELIPEFAREIDSLERKRDILALVLKMKKLEVNSELIQSDQDEIAIIKSKLEGYAEQEHIAEIEKLDIDAIRAKIQENRNQQFRLYGGEDIDLIAKLNGIDIRAELESRIRKSVEGKKTKDRDKAAKGRAIGKLMSDIRRSKNEVVSAIENLQDKIRNGTLSEDELSVIEQSGIDVSGYRSQFVDADTQIEEQKENGVNEGEVKQKMSKGLKDNATKEAIVAEMLFRDISEDEIMAKARSKLISSLTTELSEKISNIRKGKSMQDLTQQELDEVRAELRKIDIARLIYGIMSDKISDEDLEQIESLKNGEFEIDIQAKYNEIMNEDKLKREIRHDKLSKLKASITIGMEQYKKIKSIRERISEMERKDKPFSRFVYGNNWYIGLDENDYIIAQDYNEEQDVNGVERPLFEISRGESRGITNSPISCTKINKVSEDVSLEMKNSVLRRIIMMDKNKQEDRKIG